MMTACVSSAGMVVVTFVTFNYGSDYQILWHTFQLLLCES